jgi:hypothetical protein
MLLNFCAKIEGTAQVFGPMHGLVFNPYFATSAVWGMFERREWAASFNYTPALSIIRASCPLDHESCTQLFSLDNESYTSLPTFEQSTYVLHLLRLWTPKLRFYFYVPEIVDENEAKNGIFGINKSQF